METKDIRKDGNFLQAVYSSVQQNTVGDRLQFLLKKYFTEDAIPVAKHRVQSFIRLAAPNTSIRQYQTLIDDLQKLRTLYSKSGSLGFKVHSMFTVPTNKVVLSGHKTVAGQVVGSEEKMFLDLNTLKEILLKEKNLGQGFSELMEYLGADPEQGFLQIDVVEIADVLNRHFEFEYLDVKPFIMDKNKQAVEEAA